MEIFNRPSAVGDVRAEGPAVSDANDRPFSPFSLCFSMLSYAFNSVTAAGHPHPYPRFYLFYLFYYCGCVKVTGHRLGREPRSTLDSIPISIKLSLYFYIGRFYVGHIDNSNHIYSLYHTFPIFQPTVYHRTMNWPLLSFLLYLELFTFKPTLTISTQMSMHSFN